MLHFSVRLPNGRTAIAGRLPKPATGWETRANGGAEPRILTPEGFGELIRGDNMRWVQVIREAGIRME